MTISTRYILTITSLLLLVTSLMGFSPQQGKVPREGSALHYVRDQSTPPAILPLEQPPAQKVSIHKNGKLTKPHIRDIKSLNELQYFLEEDERPVAIKFYAPWCKTCLRLGLHFDRLALELGDIVRNRHKVEGSIRFAAVEYGSETSRLITETLKIRGVPTLQLYSGVHKLWEENGPKTVQGLKKKLQEIESMSLVEIRELAEELDDRILENAIEESFFDEPDFLNEEW